MQRPLLLLSLSLLSLSLTGCIMIHPHNVPARHTTRVYDADFDTVFRAALASLRETGYALIEIDYWGGIIKTAPREMRELQYDWVTVSVSEWDDGIHLKLLYAVRSYFHATTSRLVSTCVQGDIGYEVATCSECAEEI